MSHDSDDASSGTVVLGPAPATDPIADRVLLREVEAGLFGRPAPPPRVGRYALSRRIGSGGQGVVYVAHDPELDRDVAVKLLLSDRAAEEDRDRLRLCDAITVTSADAKSRVPPRLWREAQAMARLSHPHVATVYEVGWHDGTAFVAMELVDGVTLRDWLDDRPRPTAEVLEVLVQAARGLAAAHAAGLVHRDFKPHNVMVTREGVAKVLDFGLATDAAKDEEQRTSRDDMRISGPMLSVPLTRTGTVMGTPAYMAPEQRDGLAADAKGDQFAYCVTLYEALWGHRPFSGDPRAELPDALRAGSRPRRVPPWIEAVVRRGLALDPAARWPDMEALIHALTTGAARRRARVVWAGVGALLLSAVSAGAWASIQRTQDLAACADLGASIHVEVWTDDAKASARAALPDAMHDRFVAHVDRWTAAWRDAGVRACEDAEVHARTPSPLYDAARDCLQERRWALEELLGDLDATGKSEAHRLLTAAVGLPAVGACEDERALRARPRPSTDPIVRASAQVLRRKLATVARLEDRGRPGEALALATEVQAAASTLDDPALSAQIHLVVGGLQYATGAIETAERTLETGLGIAMSASADQLVGALLTELVFVVGHGAGRHDDGRRWGRLAEQWLRRRGIEDGLETADLLNYLSMMEREAGDLPAARTLQERALAMREAVVGEHVVISVSLVNLATILGMQGELAAAEEATARAIAIQTDAFGDGHPDIASAVLVMGNLRHMQGKSAEALVDFRRARAIYEAALGAEHPAVADATLNIAIAHVALGDLEEAERGFQRALRIREQALGPEHPLVAAARDDLERLRAMRAPAAEAREGEVTPPPASSGSPPAP